MRIKFLPVLLVTLCLGCAVNRAELIAVRDSMDHGTAPMRDQYSRWVEQLGPKKDGNGAPMRDASGAFVYYSRDEIDKLSPATQEAMRIMLREYSRNVERSRDRDRR